MSETHRLPDWLRRTIARRLTRPFPLAAASHSRPVCIYKVDRIGDFVLSLGALQLIAQHFGEARCRLVVSEAAAPLATAELPDIERWIIPTAASGLLTEMRPLRQRLAPAWAGEKFETLLCLRHARSLYRDLTLSWIHADGWVGFGPRPTPDTLAVNNHPELPTGYPVAPKPPWCRELLAHRTVVETVLGRSVTWDEMRPRLEPHVAVGTEIVFCPFGGERIRDYPRASWIAACRGMLPESATVRVLGPAKRRTELRQLVDDLRDAGIRAIATSDATPTEFIRYLTAARLILTVESAAAHLATALDRPAVIVMGGGHHGWFAPWGDGTRQHWLQHPLPCYGCNWDCHRSRVECLVDLPPNAVKLAIVAALHHD